MQDTSTNDTTTINTIMNNMMINNTTMNNMITCHNLVHISYNFTHKFLLESLHRKLFSRPIISTVCMD